MEHGGDRLFLVCDEGVFTYRDADALSDSLAQGFAAAGVGRGRQIAIMLDNSPEYIWTFLALGKLGAVGVPLNTEAKGYLLRYYLTDSDCEFAVLDERYRGMVETALESGGRTLDVAWVQNGARPNGASSLAEKVRPLEGEFGRRDPWVSDYDPQHQDPFLLMYTSGTTGPSKAVVMPNSHAVTTALIVAQRFGLKTEDRMYTCLPLFHVNAICYTILAALSVGASVALARRFSARTFWNDVLRYEATEFNAMGSMMKILEKQTVSEAERVQSVHTAFVVPFPSDPYAFEDRYGAKLTTTYALSEWIPVSLSAPGEGYDKVSDRGSMAGPVLEYSEVRIVDDEGCDVATGTTGEIVLRSREPWTTFREYYGKPAETLEAFQNLWFHTGDLGFKDRDDFLYFVDRKKDAIRRRGENISAHELEEILRTHEEIREVAAIAVPSELGEDDVAVYVVVQPGRSLFRTEILEYGREHLPRYMVPRYIEIVDELPKTPTSKVEKYKLVQRAVETLEDLWDGTRQGEREKE